MTTSANPGSVPVSAGNTGDLLKKAAELIDQKDDFRGAAEIYGSILEREPANIQAILGLTRVYVSANRMDDALQFCERAIGAEPRNEDAWFYKGDVLRMMGEFDKAEECFRQVIAINPGNVLALNGLGRMLNAKELPARRGYYRSYCNRKTTDEAIACFEKAIDSDPAYPNSYFNLAKTFLDISCLEEAKYNFNRCLLINPDVPIAWYHLSIIEERLGNLNNAIHANRFFIISAESRTNGEFLDLLQQAYTRADVLENTRYEDTPELNRFGRDITRLAALGKFGNVTGRDSELVQMSQSLSSGIKNDVIIVGGPGVGKSALVEALATDIIFNDFSHVLSGTRIIELNFGTIFADCSGLNNLMGVLREASDNPKIILYIDDVNKFYTSIDIMKPAVENSRIRFITTTTPEIYLNLNMNDPVLERKFDRISLKEPSRDEALEILKNCQELFQNKHRVKISNDALEAAVDLSLKFVSERRLPDKALDAIERACSLVRIRLNRQSPEVTGNPEGEGDAPFTVTSADVAAIISQRSSTPYDIVAGNLRQNSYSRITELEKFLKENLYGQDDAVKCIVERLVMAYSGVSEKRGPVGVFMLAGPCGVGKTETVRLLSKFLFGAENNIINLDQGGLDSPNFIAKLSARPHSIVLLDSDERMLDCIDFLLAAFDDGQIVLPNGKSIDLSNTIFIVTADINQAKHISLANNPGESKKTIEDLKKRFRPEFVNRIDEIIPYNSLCEGDVIRILEKMTNELNATLEKRYGLKLEFDEASKKAIAKEGYSEVYGARELRRDFEKMVKVPLGEMVLRKNTAEFKTIKITADEKGKIKLNAVEK